MPTAHPAKEFFMQMPSDWCSRARRLALPILTLLAGACSSVLDSTQDYADIATLEVTGSSPVPLIVVSSTNWQYVTNQETGAQSVATNQADSVSLDLPINRTVSITDSYRIFFQVINRDINQTASIRMRVLLDDRLVFDQAATMRDASLEYSFAYGHAVIQ
jgi:hypothetical protein